MELTAGISRGWTLLQTVSLKPLHKHTYGPKRKTRTSIVFAQMF